MNPLDNNKDCEFAKFFEKLGYEYNWDFSRRDGMQWHELWKDNDLIFQCEMGIPLQVIIDDLCVDEDFESSYFIGCDSDDKFRQLITSVREFTGKHWKTIEEREEYYKSKK